MRPVPGDLSAWTIHDATGKQIGGAISSSGASSASGTARFSHGPINTANAATTGSVGASIHCLQDTSAALRCAGNGAGLTSTPTAGTPIECPVGFPLASRCERHPDGSVSSTGGQPTATNRGASSSGYALLRPRPCPDGYDRRVTCFLDEHGQLVATASVP